MLHAALAGAELRPHSDFRFLRGPLKSLCSRLVFAWVFNCAGYKSLVVLGASSVYL